MTDRTYHSRLSRGWGGSCFMKWASPPLPWFPHTKDKPLGWVGSSNWNNRWISDIFIHEIVEHQAHMCGHGLGFERLKHVFILALRKECLLPSPPTMILLHMQHPPLVNSRYRDMNCSRVGGFGSAVQHLVVALLLRWSHSCLFVECHSFVPHMSPSSPFLSPALHAFIPFFTWPLHI